MLESGRTRFVAEVSSNHHGDLARCVRFVDVAADIGCDAVKFQLFRIDRLFAPEVMACRADLRARRAWELPPSFLPPLSEACRRRGIAFSCTPFYLEAVAELRPYVDFYKIASYELLRHDLLSACAATTLPVVISTGMATMDEILVAVERLRRAGCPSPELLHCVSGYPTPPDQTNLAAIATIRETTGCRTGWSDHSVLPGVVNRAIHRWGASMIEFHLDLDGEGDEFRTGHCWLPDAIGTVIRETRSAERSDGDGVKAPTPAEAPDRPWRADPEDGFRPLRTTRIGYVGDGA